MSEMNTVTEDIISEIPNVTAEELNEASDDFVDEIHPGESTVIKAVNNFQSVVSSIEQIEAKYKSRTSNLVTLCVDIPILCAYALAFKYPPDEYLLTCISVVRVILAVSACMIQVLNKKVLPKGAISLSSIMVTVLVFIRVFSSRYDRFELQSNLLLLYFVFIALQGWIVEILLKKYDKKLTSNLSSLTDSTWLDEDTLLYDGAIVTDKFKLDDSDGKCRLKVLGNSFRINRTQFNKITDNIGNCSYIVMDLADFSGLKIGNKNDDEYSKVSLNDAFTLFGVQCMTGIDGPKMRIVNVSSVDANPVPFSKKENVL